LRELGRNDFEAWATSPIPKPGDPVLQPKSGGEVRADNPSIRFAVKHGYNLAQVERVSTLRLPVPEDLVDAWLEEATAKSTGYRTHTWTEGIPEEWLEGYAKLMTNASVDTPAGELTAEEDVWTAERVRESKERSRAGGTFMVTTIAEIDGEIAAVTDFWYRPEQPQSVSQGWTIVLPNHRGHRLGLLVKALNLRALREHCPAVERINTWNADENEHMLGINIKMGFKPSAVEAAFNKKV
jgi:RimJ/RimL family protein N-acetyltransferase